jgi:hypothetical protein
MSKALLGNDSVNTLNARNNRNMSVYCSLLANKQLNNEFAAVSIAMKGFGKHVSTIEAEFLCDRRGGYIQRLW